MLVVVLTDDDVELAGAEENNNESMVDFNAVVVSKGMFNVVARVSSVVDSVVENELVEVVNDINVVVSRVSVLMNAENVDEYTSTVLVEDSRDVMFYFFLN
jgi:hypothetical protein